LDPIPVPEPDPQEAREILSGLRHHLEEHHGANITEDAIESAVALSVLFDTGRHLPEKAIDLVDLACARIRVPRLAFSMRRDPPTPIPRRGRKRGS